MPRRATVARSVFVCLLLARAALAVDVASIPKAEGYVSDFARVVDAASRAQLEQYALRLDRVAGVQMAFVTVDTVGGAPIEEFANNLYRKWGIGQKGKDEGLLLLLVINDKDSRLEVGRGLEPYITDGTAGGTLRQMRPMLQAGHYGDAMLWAAQTLGQRVAQAKGVDLNQYTPRPRRAPPAQQPRGLPWPVLLGGIFLLLWLFGGRGGGGGGRRHYQRRSGAGDILTGMVLGSMLGRGGGGWGGGHSGGGFGGYDSGDSFGGFGGGDSGGGGASSNW